MSHSPEKQIFRREVKARLAALPFAERRARSRAAAEVLLELPAFRDARCILGYMATETECDPSFALRAAKEEGKRIVYPKCLPEKQLGLYLPVFDDAFTVGAYGILEPDAARCEAVGAEEIDLVLLPGLAFGRDMSRLGKGAGYYDRLLPRLTAAKVGFAFDVQIFDAVPVEKWDEKADAVATNHGIIVNSAYSHL
ncbi:MAG: 5-formyltetrahydrofolate cyclo-ligase [Clostridiales bacterium]|nr:5-formyltetrahydrofolate cyclo-ligase [Clostridiales bacterium]